MKIAIGADHAGVDLKTYIKEHFSTLEFNDHGTHTSESVDYPDFAHPVANDVESGKVDRGILVCGSANGVAMSANKHSGIRAAICWNTELAQLAREHNDANILCLPARFISEADAAEMVQTFLNTEFEGGRHERRVNKISC